MFASGAVVLGFILLHLVDLRLGVEVINLRGFTYEHMEPYAQTVTVLRDPISAFVYVVGSIVLGIHLSHGFASAFQSLGLNHPKYMPLIKLIGRVFSCVIAIGFSSIVIYIFSRP
jgi:succinate dehydrogenase / fumarate reductase cytochrome b subunit